MASDVLDSLTAPMPAPPVRQFSFTDFQTNNPTAPPPGDRLDAEFDRANNAVSDVIDWTSVSLNTDGSIRDGVIGDNQLESGLFDAVADDIIAEVQPLVDQANSYASSALSSASLASASASSAATHNSNAQAAATSATTASTAAQASASSANSAQIAAANAADDAANSANHALGDANLSSDYAVVTQAWAEHMPDIIPPNILAVMGVTGDHWSSRWWANKAAGAFGQLSELYLGVHDTPPLTTSTGDPIPTGAIYYNSTNETVYLWNGTSWVPFWTPVKSTFLSLLYRATSSQTVFPLTTPDLGGHVYTISSTNPELIEVYVNGVKLPGDAPNPGAGDWTLNAATSTLTFLTPLLANSLVNVDILTPSTTVAGVSTFNTRSGTVVLNSSDVASASGLLTTGGTMNGDLTVNGTVIIGTSLAVNGATSLHDATATTTVTADNSQNVATTKFVHSVVNAIGTVVNSFNTRTGPVTLTNADITAAASPVLTLQRPAGTATALVGSTNTSPRWSVQLATSDPETGGNQGSNFSITRYDDAGTAIDTPLIINRISGTAAFTGGDVLMTAPASKPVRVALNKTSGQPAQLIGSTGGLSRWVVALGDAAPESTGQAGSNFSIGRYNDIGSLIDLPLSINRASGVANFTQHPTVAGVPIILMLEEKVNQLMARVAALEGRITP